MRYSENKKACLEKLSNKDGVIAALAIDQRGSMEKMVTGFSDEERTKKIEDFKTAVAKELTPYSSSILLDPLYGKEAVKARDENCGLIMAYEITGFRDEFRQPEYLVGWSVKRLKDLGADAVKILLYYDVDDTEENNTPKKAFVERVGSECVGEDIPFFLEIISYDKNMDDMKSKEYAKVRPFKVNQAVKEFVKPQYHVDVLKLETPVNMMFVEGYGEEGVYTKEEAKKFFKEQSDIANMPFIFLSGGVSTELFQDTLYFAKEAGSKFNGVLCGRATWKGGVPVFIENAEQGNVWLKETGVQNIEDLNKVIKDTATPWTETLER